MPRSFAPLLLEAIEWSNEKAKELSREGFREALTRIDGDTYYTAWQHGEVKVFVYNEEELLDLMVRVASRSYTKGFRAGNGLTGDAVRKARLNRGEQR